MIDINELRRLAQAATPGGWYVARGNYVYGVKEVTDGEEVWHPVIACTDDDEVSINFEGNANFIAAANPATISELLDRLEAAEKERDAELLAMYRRVRDERDALRAALQHETDCVEAAMAEIEAMRAKIEAMEKQEPFDADSDVFRSAFEAALKAGNWPATRQGDGYRSPSTQIAWRITFSTVNRLKLYLAPGAKGEEK